jgi:hypothetical protein
MFQVLGVTGSKSEFVIPILTVPIQREVADVVQALRQKDWFTKDLLCLPLVRKSTTLQVLLATGLKSEFAIPILTVPIPREDAAVVQALRQRG